MELFKRDIPTEAEIEELKNKYLNESRYGSVPTIDTCLKLLFQAAIEKDPAKRKHVALELSEYLCEPNGIVNLFIAVIDFDPSSQKYSTLNQRFLAVANVITCLPHIHIDYVDYCENILKQLKPLLLINHPKYSSPAAIVFKSLFESTHVKKNNQKKIKQTLFEPIFKPLTTGDESFCKSDESIEIILKLSQEHVPVQLFVELFPKLLYAYCAILDSPNTLKFNVELMILDILDNLGVGPACCLIEKTLFYDKPILYEKYPTDHGISFRFVQIIEQIDCDVHQILAKGVLLELLEDNEKKELMLELFFHVQSIMLTSKGMSDRFLSNSLVEDLVQKDCMDFMTSMISNKSSSKRILELISRAILNQFRFIQIEQDDFESRWQLISDCVISMLEILNVLLVVRSKLGFREKCLPVLKEFAKFLSTRINPFTDKAYFTILDLIKNIDTTNSTAETSSDTNQREFDSIQRDLNDKLIPVRVHALIRLKDEIQLNRTFFIQRISQIFDLVQSALADDEPYLFSACIGLMTELSVRKTDELLPKLTETFLNQELGLQHRLNAAETLVRLIKQLNETAPKYARQILKAFYKGCEDQEELVRVSSLVNIGILCQRLGNSLGNYTVDVLGHVRAAVENDTMQVKCAAVDLLRTALSGVSGSNLESIQSDLPQIYRMLKKMGQGTLDTDICRQITLALNEIDRISKEILAGDFSNEKLVKNIRVLSLD